MYVVPPLGGQTSAGNRLKAGLRTFAFIRKFKNCCIYGSFITDKPNPGDIDIFLVMDDNFEKKHFSSDVRIIFEHLETEINIGATIFWMLESSVLVDEKTFIEGWQVKRGGKTRRGIVEVI